jgi:hypothetical protein
MVSVRVPDDCEKQFWSRKYYTDSLRWKAGLKLNSADRILLDAGRAAESEKAGNLHSSNAGQAAGHVLNLIGELFINTADGVIDGSADQILEQLGIFAREDFGFDAQFRDLLLAVHFHGDHAAAGGGFDVHGIHLALQAFLHLAELRKHLL